MLLHFCLSFYWLTHFPTPSWCTLFFSVCLHLYSLLTPCTRISCYTWWFQHPMSRARRRAWFWGVQNPRKCTFTPLIKLHFLPTLVKSGPLGWFTGCIAPSVPPGYRPAMSCYFIFFVAIFPTAHKNGRLYCPSLCCSPFPDVNSIFYPSSVPILLSAYDLWPPPHHQ